MAHSIGFFLPGFNFLWRWGVNRDAELLSIFGVQWHMRAKVYARKAAEARVRAGARGWSLRCFFGRREAVSCALRSNGFG
jgi:hypothetical protein